MPFTSAWQVADRVIGFTVEGWQGLEFHLELIDPPDTAAYAPDDGWDNGQAKKLPYEANDNVEDPQNADVGLALDPGATTWAEALNVTPDANGTATVYLKVTDRYAGDNHQVRVKKCDPDDGCGAKSAGFPGVLHQRVVALSPIFTAWKRIHIERDKMFRRGGVLAENFLPDPDYECGSPENPICDCVADPGAECCQGIGPVFCNQIVAYEWQSAAAGDQVAVFDEVSTYETKPEPREVTAVGTPDADGLVTVTLDQGLDHAHLRAERTTTTPFQPTFSNHKSAGYGVISGCDASSNQINATDSCFYQGDLQAVEQAYNDAFMEVFAPRDGMSAVPMLPESFFSFGTESTAVQDDFSRTWFPHWTNDPGDPRRCLPNNYFHVVGAKSGSRAGLTRATSNTTFAFIETIAGDSPPGDPFVNYVRFVVNHELGHQFSVNPCECDLHDRRNAWCETLGNCAHPGLTYPIACIMNVVDDALENRTDGIDHFGIQDLFEGTPGCSGKVCAPGDTRSFPKGYGAIRTVPDPR